MREILIEPNPPSPGQDVTAIDTTDKELRTVSGIQIFPMSLASTIKPACQRVVGIFFFHFVIHSRKLTAGALEKVTPASNMAILGIHVSFWGCNLNPSVFKKVRILEFG